MTPLALAPLWQEAHDPGVTPVWLKAAPEKVEVDLWQLSQAAVVCICPLGLPNAVLPL